MATLDPDARTDADEVGEIVETDLSEAIINAFINTAHRLVDANLLDKGLSLTILAEIEKWLAAHLLSTRDQRVESESIGGEWSAKYQGKTGMGLEATVYGQQVILLDSTGTLAAAMAGLKPVTFEVYSEED